MNNVRVTRFKLDEEERDILAIFEVSAGDDPYLLERKPALTSSANVPAEIREVLIQWLTSDISETSEA